MNPILQPAYKRINCIQTVTICAVRDFTTIPITIGTIGPGTGLRLSLAYDMVKTHGGQFKVGTNEGRGTGFIIQLTVT